MDAASDEALQAVAIIGLSGRFPHAADVEQFWRNIAEGRDCVSRFTDEQLQRSGIPEALRRSPDYVPARAILDDPFLFDAPFFGFTPGEATLTDPQHRLFLECAWEALEQAGYDPSRYADYIGVYGGADANAYALMGLLQSGTELWGLIGNDKDYLATRVSFKLNLRGPGMTIQTACSTSLVAVQVACQALLGYQCDMALAGGAGIAAPQEVGYLYHKGGILSPDGHCRTFDAKAKGTVGGSGVGVVLLKRLKDALAEGDTIVAVIKAAAINNDGSGKIGYTAPSVEGQAEVIATALAMAGVDPDTIGLVEAHGTATELGDPVEIAALTDAYRSGTSRTGYCAIGSVKSNLGHMNSAAGIGGLIKAVMALKHRQIPPSIHFESPNPMIDFAGSPFYVSTKLAPWPAGPHPRRAAVSSFGVGGTNAHVILEEAPAPEPSALPPARPSELLVLSARSEAALGAMAQNLADHLGQHPELPLADVAYTLQVGRQLFKHRRLVVCRAAEEARAALSSPAPSMRREPRRAPVVFMFPGQGSQHVDMGRDLYEVEPAFRDAVDACASALVPHLSLDLRQILYPGEAAGAEAQARIVRTEIAQPALFTVEYALAKLWMSWGICPEAMIGHSVGEYVAACLAGVIEFEDALRLVAARGRLMGGLPPGAMIAAAISEDEASRLTGVSVAAINAPGLTVLSGPTAAIEDAVAELRTRGVEAVRLHTSHAFHSEMMDPILGELRALVSGIRLSPPEIPYLSNLTGTWITPADAQDPGYWVSHLRRPVRFAAGIAELLGDPDRLLLEVGPGRALTSLATKQGTRTQDRAFASLGHPRAGASALACVLDALGRLYLSDVAVDWEAFHARAPRRRVPLPTYPFERRRYVRELDASALGATPAAGFGADPPAKRAEVQRWLYAPSWRRALPVPRAADGDTGRLLLFMGGGPLGAEIAERLARVPRRVITVTPEDTPELRRLDNNRYAIDPASPEQYRALMDAVAEEDGPPERVVHLLGLGAGATPALDGPARFDAASRVGFSSVLRLAQALAARRGDNAESRPVSISVVTSGVAAVLDDDPIAPEAATILGLCQVIPQEIPHIRCNVIDVVVPESPGARADLAGRVVAEIQAGGSDALVAHRGGHRWLPAHEPIPVATSASSPNGDRPAPDPAPLRERGVYLILGGTGGVGLSIARHLARAARARIVLAGRAGLVARDEWDAWLRTHGDGDRSSQRIRKVRALEELGAEVLVVSADASDPEQVSALVERTIERFGALHGVFFAVGGPLADSLRAVADTGPEHCDAQFRARGRGLHALAGALPEGVDFCLLCSSISAALGGVGLAAYAAAHHFMDAFAAAQNRRGRARWIAVDWDAWAPEDDGALAAVAIRPDEGGAALGAILRLGLDHVAVSTMDLAARRDHLQRLESAHRRQTDRGEGGVHPRPDIDTPYVAPRNEVEAALADIWQRLFAIDRVGVDDNFFKLGGDSLLAIQLAARIRDAFGLDIPLVDLFEQATIAGLAEKIERMRAEDAGGREAALSTLAMIEELSEDEVKKMLAELEGKTV